MTSRLLVDNKSKEVKKEKELSEANKVDESKHNIDSDFYVWDWERKLIVERDFLGACERASLLLAIFWILRALYHINMEGCGCP